MIQLFIDSRDVSQLVEQITWSGDTKQVARQLACVLPTKPRDYYLPKVSVEAGMHVQLTENGKTLFGGVVFDVEKSTASGTVTCTAFDYMFYVMNSDVNKVFNTTPENATAWICSSLGITLGTAAKTGIKVYMPCLGQKAYEAIMMAYTAASRKTGKKYIPLMRNVNQLCVIEKGSYCGVVLDGDYNLTDASYKVSLQKLVNKVLITDKNGNIIKTIQDTGSRQKYGTVQAVYKQEDGKNATAQAKALLKTVEQSGAVTAISDTRAVSGYSIAVQEPISGLYGRFFIESDSHTFSNGKNEMQLTLAFDNLMDEKEIEKTEEKKK